MQYNKILYLIEDSIRTRSLRRKRVTIYDYPDSKIEIRSQGVSLPYSVFDKLQRIDQGTVASPPPDWDTLYMVSGEGPRVNV